MNASIELGKIERRHGSVRDVRYFVVRGFHWNLKTSRASRA
jgi:hypothetical protein